MDGGQKYSILLIDSAPHPDILKEENHTDFLSIARSGAAARAALADPAQNIAAVVIHPKITSPGAIRLIQLTHRHRPATPIFTVNTGFGSADAKAVAFGSDEVLRLALASTIASPRNVEDIRSLISPEILAFRSGKKYSATAELRELAAPETASDHDYIAVPAADFLSGIPSPFDIYIRLQSGRYLKILNAKGVFPAERIQGYLEKGVTHFHLGRASQTRCLTYCDLMGKFLLDHPSVSPLVKLANTFNLGQDLIESIRDGDFRQEHVDYAYAFVGEAFALVRQLKLGKDLTVRAFMNDLTLYEHSAGTALVASLLSLPLQIETFRAFHTIGVAAIFHDIGLKLTGRQFRTENPAAMTEEERRAFFEHPRLGAEFLAKFEGIDPAVITAIAKHHERRNNSGFPKLESSGDLNRIAEIIGISDEFVRLVTAEGHRTSKEIFEEMKSRVFDGFSFPVIQAFEQIFMPTASAKTRSAKAKTARLRKAIA